MEQQTVTIKNFLWITDPDIHLRRIAYPSEREKELRDEEPDFAEEGWARRKVRKK